MFFLTDRVPVDEYNQQVENRNREKETYRQNNLWHLLCMSLVDNKDEIEEKAFALAEKHGLLGALRLQHTTGTLQNGNTIS